MMSRAMVAELLRRTARAYAQAAVAELRTRRPALVDGVLPGAFAAPVADLEVRVLQLAEAVAFDVPELYGDVAAWYTTAFHHRGVPADYAAESFAALDCVLARELPAGGAAVLADHFAAARRATASPPQVPPSPIERPGTFADAARRFLLAALEGRGDDALAVVQRAIDDGADVASVHDELLMPVQQEIGRMWLLGEAPIADEHFASQLVGRGLERLADRLPRPPASAPTVLAFAVAGNLHDLGIRIVAQRLQLAGFRVTSLGADMPSSDLAWAVADRHFDLLAVSATMLLHLGAAAQVVDERNRALGGQPPILVGGGPFARVPDLHRRLGADAGAGDAVGAVRAAQDLWEQAQRRRSR